MSKRRKIFFRNSKTKKKKSLTITKTKADSFYTKLLYTFSVQKIGHKRKQQGIPCLKRYQHFTYFFQEPRNFSKKKIYGVKILSKQ